MSGSYFYNSTETRNSQFVWRETFLSSDSSTVYAEENTSANTNYNHRFDSKIEYALSSATTLLVRPQLSMQDYSSSSSFLGSTVSSIVTLNESSTARTNSVSGYTTSANVVVRHRFPTRGRTLSADVLLRANHQEDSKQQNSLATVVSSGQEDTTNQTGSGLASGYTLSSRFVYTEPLTSTGLIQLSYTPTYASNRSDARIYQRQETTDALGMLDSTLSNTYESRRTTQSIGVDVQYRVGGLNIFAGASYEVTNLAGDVIFPIEDAVGRRFRRFLPNAMLMYTPARGTNLRIMYRSSTNAPTISQLQGVIDNSNPLQLRAGNPDLKQSTMHSLLTRYISADAENGASNLLFFSLSYSEDVIGNATVTGSSGGTVVQGISLGEGVQLTYPVNLDHSWSAQGLFTHAVYVEWLSSNVSVTTGVSFSWSPGLINGALNISKTTTFNEGIVLASNVTPDLDFTLSYSANYSVLRYSLRSELDDRFFFHTGSVKVNWIFAESYVVRSDLTHSLYDGEQSTLKQSYALWNVAVSKKFFANNKGELRLAVADIFNKNRGITRMVTESSIENTTSLVLGRYVLVTFTYTIG